MRTRYKIGQFNQPVSVAPGDELHLTITEKSGHKQKVSEDITVSMVITHWVMFYVKGVGFGGMFGGPDIGEKMSEIFVNPELVKCTEDLMT